MYQHFAYVYDQIFPLKEEIKTQIKPWIKIGGKAIDLGCATGHLVGYLHQQGMLASGVDSDDKMIEVATLNYPMIPFVLGDMVEYVRRQTKVDLVTCLGNTLPHLDYQQLKILMHHVFHALSKHGVMIIQMLNYDKIMTELPEHLPVINIANLTFQRTYHYHQQHIVFETKLQVDDHISTGSTILYSYKKDELKTLFESQGFEVAYYQNLYLDPLTPSSSHQTWILTRK